MVKAEGIADGHEPFAHLERIGIAELEEGQFLLGVHLEQGEVGLLVGADELGHERRGLAVALVEGDVDHVGIGHHMIVGDDIAVSRDDEARTKRLLLFLRGTLSAARACAELIEELPETGGHVAEHLAEEFFGTAPLGRAFRADIDHRRAALGGQRGKIGKRGGLRQAAHHKQRGQRQSKGFSHFHREAP